MRATKKTRTTEIEQNFYCSQKFWWLTVDLEKRKTYSCCVADPDDIDFDWLDANPGQLFNTPRLQQDRVDMLNNQAVKSCETNCWRPERQGLQSRRLQMHSQQRSHTDPQITAPEKLQIVLGSTCNLTCAYCCKTYSSAWARDLRDHGPYLAQPRFELSAKDQVILKLSHNDLAETERFQQLVQEVSALSAQRVLITGGEPFLYNGLSRLIDSLPGEITVFTGLGVDAGRLDRQLSSLGDPARITIAVSAENCGLRYEFNRYGNTWDKFQRNLALVESKGHRVCFSTVISNLTIHGLLEFYERYPAYEKLHNFCNEPDFLALNVLDKTTKSDLIDRISETNIDIKQQILETMQQEPTIQQQQDFAVYIGEFARRRSLDLDIFPDSMLKWINYVV
jgi:hypothetical protein